MCIYVTVINIILLFKICQCHFWSRYCFLHRCYYCYSCRGAILDKALHRRIQLYWRWVYICKTRALVFGIWMYTTLGIIINNMRQTDINRLDDGPLGRALPDAKLWMPMCGFICEFWQQYCWRCHAKAERWRPIARTLTFYKHSNWNNRNEKLLFQLKCLRWW